MDENNVNINVENESEEVKSAIYSSKVLMNKELFYDFSSINYSNTKIIFLVFFCLVAYLVCINLLVGNYDTVIGSGPFISLIMILIYFRIRRAIKISYERNLISAGKESSVIYELFEDKIVCHVEELKREYSYNQITKFFETNNFILLHLQHNLHITIEKNSLNASVDEVKSFLISKCTLVKKKKFINCSNDPKWSLVFLIALIVVCVIGMIVGLVLKLNNLF